MAEFKRMSKNSNIATGCIEKMLFNENERTMILQLVPTGGIIIEDDQPVEVFICEYISKLEEDAGIKEPVHVAGDIDFENDLDTTINKDPFGGKWSGRTLREVFEAGDRAWVERALKEMKNAFLRDRIEYIVKRGGYGQINY